MPDSAVVDASLLSAIFLREERWAQYADRLDALGVVWSVPFVRFEVSNAIWKHHEFSVESAEDLAADVFRFRVQEEFSDGLARIAMSLARANRIAFYDAAYVALACSLKLPLWTLDERQAQVARKLGVEVWR